MNRLFTLTLGSTLLCFFFACGASRPQIKHTVGEDLAAKLGGTPLAKVQKAKATLDGQQKKVNEKKAAVKTAQGEIGKADAEMGKRKNAVSKAKSNLQKAKDAVKKAEESVQKAERGIEYAKALRTLAERKVDYSKSLVKVEEDKALVLRAQYELEKFQGVAVSNGAKGELYTERLKDFTTQLLATKKYVQENSGADAAEAKKGVDEASNAVKSAKGKL